MSVYLKRGRLKSEYLQVSGEFPVKPQNRRQIDNHNKGTNFHIGERKATVVLKIIMETLGDLERAFHVLPHPNIRRYNIGITFPFIADFKQIQWTSTVHS